MRRFFQRLAGANKYNKGIVGLLVGIIGITALITSSASGTLTSQETESGTVSGSATIGSDATASEGKYVRFGSAAWSTTATFQIGSGQVSLGDTSHDRWVVIQNPEYAAIPSVHAANPKTGVIAYQESEADNSPQYGCASVFPHLTSGVDYCVMKANYPSVFLKLANGSDATYPDYPYISALDPSLSSFQDQWQKQVIARVIPDGFQGVMADDTNVGGVGHGLTGLIYHADGAPFPDSQYGPDWVSWSQYVIPRIKAAGLAYFGNYACNPWDSCETNVENISKIPGSGHLREFWMRWNDGTVFTDSEWTSLMAQAANEMANGGHYLALGYGSLSETAVMRYMRASFLLAWNGADGDAFAYDCNGNTDCHNANWTVEIGTPAEPRTAVGAGWIRHYTGGVVVIDPSSTTAQTFSLGGTYTDQNGVVRSSITLQPATAMILRD